MNRFKINKEACKARRVAVLAHVLVHVADGINVDERAHSGDHQHHGHRKGIHPEGPLDVQVPGADPIYDGHGRAARVACQENSLQDGNDEGQPGCAAGHDACAFFTQPPANQQVYKQAQHGEGYHQGRQTRKPSTT